MGSRRRKMATECIRISIHSSALAFGHIPDPRKPALSDIVTSEKVLADAAKLGIATIGFNLSYAQRKALFAVQLLLDRTDFKGNANPVKSKQPDVYFYYDVLPVLEVKLADYLRAYGLQVKDRGRGKQEFSPQARRVAITALESLSTQRFLLVYEKSKAEKSWKKVRVEAVAPLIKLDQKKGSRTIRITPNPVLVDHVDSYFILTPENIFSLAASTGITRSRFLEFLLYQAEMKRRQERREEEESEYEVRLQPEVIAHALRLVGALAAGQKNRIRIKLKKIYRFAVDVNWLSSFALDQKGTKKRIVDVLYLNRKMFESFRTTQSLSPTVEKSTSSGRKV